MDRKLFEGDLVRSDRVIHTPSGFAKNSLIWLQEAGELRARRQYTSSRENLASYLCFIVMRGKGTLVYENTEYPLSKGEVVFIDCRRPYSHTTSKDFWQLKWVHFNGFSMPDIYAKYRERGGTPAFFPREQARYTELLDELKRLAGEDIYLKDMKLNSALCMLLEKLMEDAWDPDRVFEGPSAGRELGKIRNYIEEHCKEKISLDDLSEMFYINKYYLSRLFKERFGMSIGAFLTQRRITRAKYLLRFSSDTVEEIGLECGFDDPNYFSRTFRKVEGTSPRNFRKLWNS